MKKVITGGYTNISYKDGDKFYQEKILTGFNHKIDYSILSGFGFVPKLIFNNEKEISWDFIEGEIPTLTIDELKIIADQLYELHNSKVKFPPSNHAARVKKYRKILNERGINLPVINDYFKRINNILAKSKKDVPLHNDLWNRNMIKKDNKIYFIDWEYATMGDRHFDLAYFICSSNLTEKEEKEFLDQYHNYWEDYLIQQKILVNYLIVLWINAQDIKPFDDKYYIDQIYKLDKLYQTKKLNKEF
ncbi:phosphotransferase [Mycoplasma crocodyli]|uniref:PTS system, lichenan-specific IIA component LicA n=1 Tax=Mycoplasma crocodyli (strain ATCC 51981 / MP145) TaxID=512564 RepID=D5E4R2_MYCCM|nr:phosphotransferase [Mycoplasma crocodyli]ADE19492.1 PTS system, lichenan-specific IIA component LicA [Mycoplasma crocodyli MP145]